MTPEDAEEWTQAQAQGIGSQFRFVDLAIKLGVPAALGLSTQDWVNDRLGGYTRLAVPVRRDVHRELASEGMTQREIAQRTGVSAMTVNRDLEADPVPNVTEPSLPSLLGDPDPVPDVTEPLPEPKQSRAQRMQSSESNEWYTPSKYIEAARTVLGGIDLDPASSAVANANVQAARFYSLDDDGLSQEWKGRIWLNPPYGGKAAAFISKLIGAHADHDVTAAVALVSSHSTDTEWFMPLWNCVLCFTYGRIHFVKSDGSGQAGATHGSVFAYFGDQPDLFAAEFSKFGSVVARWA